jgi:hypothetical protein
VPLVEYVWAAPHTARMPRVASRHAAAAAMRRSLVIADLLHTDVFSYSSLGIEFHLRGGDAAARRRYEDLARGAR